MVSAMKTEEIIRKCIELPGISMKTDGQSTELILSRDDGNGSMTFFPLFPGITLAYISIDSPSWPAPELDGGANEERPAAGSGSADDAGDLKPPLLINYCIEGRCEMVLNSGSFVYVRSDELSLSQNFAGNNYVYPGQIYKGLEFFIDTETACAENPFIISSLCLDLSQLEKLYCPDGGTYISEGTEQVAGTFHKMWELYSGRGTMQAADMKLHTLELFSLLLNEKEIPGARPRTFYTRSQVDIAHETERIITVDLSENHPARELSERFGISETSLKNYFRGVFGSNISVYLREMRMNRAAELLADTRESVAAIGESVGYLNQSKFAAVFRKQFGVSPLEYRRAARLRKNTGRG